MTNEELLQECNELFPHGTWSVTSRSFSSYRVMGKAGGCNFLVKYLATSEKYRVSIAYKSSSQFGVGATLRAAVHRSVGELQNKIYPLQYMVDAIDTEMSYGEGT